MSPILVRPVREQFEHDRVIRVLQVKYKRKYEAVINPGAEQNASVGVGDLAMYPDVVLFSLERGRKLQGTVEVETAESINTLEAQAEWGPFSRLRAPFFLYVPAASIDTVRRLCTEHAIAPAEIWTYHAAADQVRFTMVHRAPEAAERPRAEKAPAERPAERKAAERNAPERKPVPERRVAAAKKASRGTAAKKGTARTPARPSRAAAPVRKAAKKAAAPAARKKAKRR